MTFLGSALQAPRDSPQGQEGCWCSLAPTFHPSAGSCNLPLGQLPCRPRSICGMVAPGWLLVAPPGSPQHGGAPGPYQCCWFSVSDPICPHPPPPPPQQAGSLARPLTLKTAASSLDLSFEASFVHPIGNGEESWPHCCIEKQITRSDGSRQADTGPAMNKVCWWASRGCQFRFREDVFAM